MIEPTGHCPFLGLKQNRAIRFAAPTPEHRCYVNGEPIEIPVDQANYCLSQGHVRCPLYMGLTLSTTGDGVAPLPDRAASRPMSGVRGWLATLPPRDRAIYLLMLALLLLIVAAYLALSLRSLIGASRNPALTATVVANVPTRAVPVPTLAVPTGATTTEATSAPLPSPTALPTDVPSPTATAGPTEPTLILPPTRIPETPTNADQQPTSASVQPSVPPAPLNTAAPAPTRGGSQPPVATALPTSAPPPTAAISTERLTLYFGDTTGTLFVPVQRVAQVENQQVARAAVRELIAGPRNGLQRLLVPDVQVRDLAISGGTATINFDRAPTGVGDDRGLYAVVLTLTQFQSIRQVQFQINGQNLGAPLGRPVVNPLNPQNLPPDSAQTEFLPLYFLSVDGVHDVRIIRMVPKTAQVAEATARALLEGPGGYANAVRRLIPAATELRGIRRDGTTITVDFTQPFAEASERDATVRTVALALTTLPNVNGVQILIEGRSLAEFWGGQYGGVFGRPMINGE